MSETQTLSSDPQVSGSTKRSTIAFEDAQQRLLRYHLLRLTVVGLSREEIPLILELARGAFGDTGVADQVRAIADLPGRACWRPRSPGSSSGPGPEPVPPREWSWSARSSARTRR